MRPARKLNRRSFLASVSGAAVGGGALLGLAGEARAFQLTDSDAGDPAGQGRRGITDRDYEDPSGQGAEHGVPQRTPPDRRSGFTDRDPSDRAGNGRGTGLTDRDPSDPRGGGRRGNGTGGITPRNPGEPVGTGRRTQHRAPIAKPSKPAQ